MYQSNPRHGTASAPESPRKNIRSPFSRTSSRSSRESAQQNSSRHHISALATPSKRISPPPFGRASFRTAPSSPARQQNVSSSPQARAGRSNKTISSKNGSEFSPRSIDSREDGSLGSRKSFEKPPRNSSIDRGKKSKPRVPHHRKSNSNDTSGTAESDFLPYIEEDASSTASSLDLGPLFLKLASAMHLSGENPVKALECASRAAKFLERASCGRPSLEFIMSLYILAAIHCKMRQWEIAEPILQRAVSLPFLMDDVDHALAAFAGNMQLGDVLAILGRQGDALSAYHRAYEIQKKALGDMDPQVGETCSYLAEAHLQALQFEEALDFCTRALTIHGEHSQPGSVEEAKDRKLMALILSSNGNNEAALEHLVLANAAFTKHNLDADVAAVDLSIGDTYVALGRYDEAVFSYQKALSLFRTIYGENHVKIASVFVSLAQQYLKSGKHREAKSYCESALRIYGRQNAGHKQEDLASGLTEMASLYENMNEREQALLFLQRAHDILDALPGHQNALAGIDGQMGVLYYVLGRHEDAFLSLKDAISRLRASGEGRSSMLAVLLNQMGLACVGLNEIWHAADLFEEAKSIFEEVMGKQHTDTLAISSNLAGVYDALGRHEEAIDLLESVLDVKEERLGTVHPEVEDEKHRLMQLLKETGRERVRKTNTLEELLLLNNVGMHK